MWRLVYWARLAAIVFIAMGLLLAVSGILISLAHPDMMVFTWQLFVIAVDAWILSYLAKPHVKDAFDAQLHYFHASQPEFHTGWFVESLATQRSCFSSFGTAGIH